MVTIDADFDGTRVILPDNFRARGPGRVSVSFPDELVETNEARRPTLREVIERAKPSGRTVEDVNRQIREGRDGPDPWERLGISPKDRP